MDLFTFLFLAGLTYLGYIETCFDNSHIIRKEWGHVLSPFRETDGWAVRDNLEFVSVFVPHRLYVANGSLCFTIAGDGASRAG
ncbi:hypothetical protein JIR001_28410 [Polycladomyces abyssicola]|uniref:Uncharacterized protein n=1 Tax=Polycladomyces abyssicola TaxID=1125966 RepID=A0A8D5ZQ76_9BACL|nr:hypothetical protein JIR001_28410 [Polycladomyces abyssicola]